MLNENHDDDSVFFLSLHRHPFYPGTGTETETGTGSGLGATLNVPIAFGTPRETYLDLFKAALDRAVERNKPDIILLSAGFDAHEADPIGSLGLQTGDFGTLTSLVCNAAAIHSKGRVVSFLEGGYNLTALADSVSVHLKELQIGSLSS